MIVGAADRAMDGDQFRAVREGRLDLDVVDHRGDPVHHLIGGDDMRARLHQFGDRAPVARALDHEIGNQGHCFRVVELDAALEAPARHHRRHGDQKLVFFARRQIHADQLSVTRRFETPRPAPRLTPTLSRERARG